MPLLGLVVLVLGIEHLLILFFLFFRIVLYFMFSPASQCLCRRWGRNILVAKVHLGETCARPRHTLWHATNRRAGALRGRAVARRSCFSRVLSCLVVLAVALFPTLSGGSGLRRRERAEWRAAQGGSAGSSAEWRSGGACHRSWCASPESHLPRRRIGGNPAKRTR